MPIKNSHLIPTKVCSNGTSSGKSSASVNAVCTESEARDFSSTSPTYRNIQVIVLNHMDNGEVQPTPLLDSRFGSIGVRGLTGGLDFSLTNIRSSSNSTMACH